MLVSLDPEVELSIANSIWIKNNFNVEKEFIDVTMNFFNAVVEKFNFDDPSATNIINDWVSQNTNGNIPIIIEDIKPTELLILLNALYFKGNWTLPFEKSETKFEEFILKDGLRKKVPMMSQTSVFGVFSENEIVAVDLSYGAEAFSMTVILPPADEYIDDFISDLNNEKLNTWLSGFAKEKINFKMPKFKLEYGINLIDVLSALGMGVAFSSANFSKINPNAGIFITKVLHKTFVEVNEEGTEAAAATAVIFGRSLPASITINRPFVFMIRERLSNTILFIGKVVDPEYE